MSMKKVGSIEVYELDENLDKYTRKEREEYINELFKQEYQGKEISYLLSAVITCSNGPFTFSCHHDRCHLSAIGQTAPL